MDYHTAHSTSNRDQSTHTSSLHKHGNGSLMKAYLKKMKEIEETKYNNLPEKMKATYHTNSELNCGIARCNGKEYLIDYTDKDAILNFHKKFSMASTTDTYPSYGENSKRISYLEFLYKYNVEQNCYVFKNGNSLDLRRCNVIIYPKYAQSLLDGYNIIETIEGHTKTIGTDAGVIKNPMWKVQDDTGEYYIMYCEPGLLVQICQESYTKILQFENTHNDGNRITWYAHTSNYIHGRIGKMKSHLFMHQVIMDYYGKGSGTGNLSIDHIDRNTLNNRRNNLRIATREEQQNNTKGIIPGTKEREAVRKNYQRGLPMICYTNLYIIILKNMEAEIKQESSLE